MEENETGLRTRFLAKKYTYISIAVKKKTDHDTWDTPPELGRWGVGK
jgi:hypothetical protein